MATFCVILTKSLFAVSQRDSFFSGIYWDLSIWDALTFELGRVRSLVCPSFIQSVPCMCPKSFDLSRACVPIAAEIDHFLGLKESQLSDVVQQTCG